MTNSEYSVRPQEYITYGLGPHYLLKVLIIQFGALLLTFQFARPLSISVNNSNLFIGVYAFISVVFITITFVFARNMCRRTLSPGMHNITSVILSTLAYLFVAAIIVLLGYVLLIITVKGIDQIGPVDGALSCLFATVSAAILTVGYHDEFDQELPSRENSTEAIDQWIENESWVEGVTNSDAQRRQLNEYIQSCDKLAVTLSHAQTEAGIQLANKTKKFVSEFKCHDGKSKEFVITGGKHDVRGDPDLQIEHEQFQQLKTTLQEISE